ncbi:MAG: hypothetical protein ACI4JT_07535 [Oscillospiraceae bacterium]
MREIIEKSRVKWLCKRLCATRRARGCSPKMSENLKESRVKWLCKRLWATRRARGCSPEMREILKEARVKWLCKRLWATRRVRGCSPKNARNSQKVREMALQAALGNSPSAAVHRRMREILKESRVKWLCKRLWATRRARLFTENA